MPLKIVGLASVSGQLTPFLTNWYTFFSSFGISTSG
jgi:hypothetical protein